jgi:CRISPR-associated protein Csx17
MYRHILQGCRPRPLASYLKAIGILRILAEQRDPQAKGCWDGEAFILTTELDGNAAETFFCNEYAPTPIVAPWNGGSGFYLGDSTEGIDAIANSELKRLQEYRKVIEQIRSWPEMSGVDTVNDIIQTLQNAIEETRPGKKRNDLETLLREIQSKTPESDVLGNRDPGSIQITEIDRSAKEKSATQAAWKAWWKAVKKARTKCNEVTRGCNKEMILPVCRAKLPESVLHWLDAVYVIQSDNSFSYNPVLGTGGNEGRLELSNNFMQRVAELFILGDTGKTRNLFRSAVFDTVISGLTPAKIGQYDPGRAGGYNQGMEVETKDFKINSWDFVLTIEGALVLAGAVVRRNPTEDRSRFTTPFTVKFSPVGFSSSAYNETGRFETWLPLWCNPATYVEVKYLFGEGRTVLGRRIARTGIEFSRAVGTLGVDRGIDAFERYAFLERRGQSYAAIPAGRIAVGYRPGVEVLDEFDASDNQIRRFLAGFTSKPATFQSAKQRIDEATFIYCQRPDPFSFSTLVRAIGSFEKLVALRDRNQKPSLDKPLLGISPRWISYSDDGSVEVRIAASLASIRRTGDVGPLRTTLSGVDPLRPWQWRENQRGKQWFGSSLAERLSTVLSRRLMEAKRSSVPTIPIEGGLPLSPHDIMAFLFGDCEDTKIEELLWGFTLIDWRKPGLSEVWRTWEKPLAEPPLSRAWCLLKLLHTPGKIRGIEIRSEPRIVPLLLSGRIQEACEVAIRRLKVSELHPFDVIYKEDVDPIRLIGSLLIPVKDQWKLESLTLEKANA